MSMYPPPNDPQQNPYALPEQPSYPPPAPPAYPAYPTHPTYPTPSSPPAYSGYQPPSQPLYTPPSAPPGVLPPPLRRAVGPTNSTGAAVASVGGIVAVIAYFALPYVNLGILGSLTGAQTANLIDTAYSAAQQFSAYSSAYSTGTTPSSSGGGVSPGLILWAEVILAGIAGGIALTQWLRSRNGGAPPARGGMIAVLITALLSLLILLYQLVGLESSTLGQMLASALGFGFWLMILGMLAAVVGAIAQMRAR